MRPSPADPWEMWWPGYAHRAGATPTPYHGQWGEYLACRGLADIDNQTELFKILEPTPVRWDWSDPAWPEPRLVKTACSECGHAYSGRYTRCNPCIAESDRRDIAEMRAAGLVGVADEFEAAL